MQSLRMMTPAPASPAAMEEPWAASWPDTAEIRRRPDGIEISALPPSVNFHLWAPCNMRCRFCFAPFQDVVADVLPAGHLPREESLRLVKLLAARFQKVSFAGGEPTLCPWLPELVRTAKEQGAVTMLVTNGSRLPAVIDRLEGALDWVALSIDSASERTLVSLGRAVQGRRALSPERYAEIAEMVRGAGMRLKVNTVVTSLNAGEDMSELISVLRPERWKLLQVLPVEGQNSGRVEPLLCAAADFSGFVARHEHLEAEGIAVVPEENEDMRGSYAMVDPAGRFFDNASGGHRYSGAILREGLDTAWSQVHFSMGRFLGRGGEYDWGGGR
jgi:radical S-adenosyl methionine domain-containing protein 2